jgi:hypothetical protein
MDDVARVVLAVESQEVAEEILRFLDRSGRARVVATAADDRHLHEAVRQLEGPGGSRFHPPGVDLSGIQARTRFKPSTHRGVSSRWERHRVRHLVRCQCGILGHLARHRLVGNRHDLVPIGDAVGQLMRGMRDAGHVSRTCPPRQ